MKSDLALSVFEIVSSPVCVSSEDGEKVYDRLAVGIKENQRIVLSFYNVTTLTPAFLNTAVGQLYGAFSEAQIRASLKLVDIEPIDLALVKRVTENAKQYFNDVRKVCFPSTETD